MLFFCSFFALKLSSKGVNKSKVQKPKDFDIAGMMAKTRDVVVRLERLDLTSLTFSETNPNTVLLPKQKKIPTLNFCKECADSFDDIFEAERKVLVKPYVDSLESQLKRNEELSKELADLEQKWHDESNKWYQLSNQLDYLLDEYNTMFNKNQDLKTVVSRYYEKTVMLEHNYA